MKLGPTKIMAQHGHDTGRTLQAVKNGLADGAMLSPRDITSKAMRRSAPAFVEAGDLLMDPQLYVLSWMQRQTFDPTRTLEYGYFRDARDVYEGAGLTAAVVEDALAFQRAHRVSRLTAPGLVISAADPDVGDEHLRVWDDAVRIADQMQEETSLFVTAAIDERVLHHEEQRKNLIDHMTNPMREIAGWYVLPFVGNPRRQPPSAATLGGVMDVIWHVRLSGRSVTVGFCGVEAALYATAGADAVCVGMQNNTRFFSDDRWVRQQGGRQEDPPKWVLVPGLMRELRLANLAPLVDQLGGANWDCDCGYCDLVADAEDPLAIKAQWTPDLRESHYLAVVRRLVNELSKRKTPQGRAKALKARLLSAKTLYKQIADPEVPLDRTTDASHLDAWLGAIGQFESHFR